MDDRGQSGGEDIKPTSNDYRTPLLGLREWSQKSARVLEAPVSFSSGHFSPYSACHPCRHGCRIMATVNQNMFGASITEKPRGAQLMVLPLNLLVEIVSHVGIAHRFPTPS